MRAITIILDEIAQEEIVDVTLTPYVKINIIRHFEWYDGSCDWCDFEITVPFTSYENMVEHINKILTPEREYDLTKGHSVISNTFDIDCLMDDKVYYTLINTNVPNFQINKALHT